MVEKTEITATNEDHRILSVPADRDDVDRLKRILPYTECIHEARRIVSQEGECLLLVRTSSNL